MFFAHLGEPFPCPMLVLLRPAPSLVSHPSSSTDCPVLSRPTACPATHGPSPSASCPLPPCPVPSRLVTPLPIPSQCGTPHSAPPLVAEKKKSKQTKTRQQMKQHNEKDVLFFCRHHYKYGKGYERVGKRRMDTIIKKILPCDWRFPFETVLRQWRYEFETGEKLFEFRKHNIQTSANLSEQKDNCASVARHAPWRGHADAFWQRPMNSSWPLSWPVALQWPDTLERAVYTPMLTRSLILSLPVLKTWESIWSRYDIGGWKVWWIEKQEATKEVSNLYVS